MQVICTSFQTDIHASNPSLSYLLAGCCSYHSANSVNQSTEGHSHQPNTIIYTLLQDDFYSEICIELQTVTYEHCYCISNIDYQFLFLIAPAIVSLFICNCMCLFVRDGATSFPFCICDLPRKYKVQWLIFSHWGKYLEFHSVL